MSDMKDNGERQQFETGAMRQPTKGNISFDLLALLSMIKQAKIFQKGVEKYESRNWENGMSLSRYFDSSMRHLIKFALNFKDEDHLSQAIWNMSCLQETKMRIDAGMLPESLDDLPSEFFKNIKGDEKFAYLFDDMNNSDENQEIHDILPFKCRSCGKEEFEVGLYSEKNEFVCLSITMINAVVCSNCNYAVFTSKTDEEIDRFIKHMNVNIIKDYRS